MADSVRDLPKMNKTVFLLVAFIIGFIFSPIANAKEKAPSYSNPNDMTQQIQQLKIKVQKLQNQNKKLQNRITELESQVDELEDQAECSE